MHRNPSVLGSHVSLAAPQSASSWVLAGTVAEPVVGVNVEEGILGCPSDTRNYPELGRAVLVDQEGDQNLPELGTPFVAGLGKDSLGLGNPCFRSVAGVPAVAVGNKAEQAVVALVENNRNLASAERQAVPTHLAAY